MNKLIASQEDVIAFSSIPFSKAQVSLKTSCVSLKPAPESHQSHLHTCMCFTNNFKFCIVVAVESFTYTFLKDKTRDSTCTSRYNLRYILDGQDRHAIQSLSDNRSLLLPSSFAFSLSNSKIALGLAVRRQLTHDLTLFALLVSCVVKLAVRWLLGVLCNAGPK